MLPPVLLEVSVNADEPLLPDELFPQADKPSMEHRPMAKKILFMPLFLFGGIGGLVGAVDSFRGNGIGFGAGIGAVLAFFVGVEHGVVTVGGVGSLVAAA